MISLELYCIPQLNLVCWDGNPGILLYTSAKSDPLGWSSMDFIIYPSQIWFVRGYQPGVLPHTPVKFGFWEWSVKVYSVLANSGWLGWSAMDSNVNLSQIWFFELVSQGFYCIAQLDLVYWGDQPWFLLYTPSESGSLGWSTRGSIVCHSLIWFI